MANLIPLSNSSLIKPKKSAIIKADKFLAPKPKSSSAIIKADKFLAPKPKSSSAIVKYSDKSSQTSEGDDILQQIQKKVVKIDKLLKGSLLLSKKESEKKRVSEEQKDFDKKESELEKKKPKSIPGIKLPSLPKMGFLDWIRNFITQTILGFFAVRLIEYLPKLLKLLPVVLKAGEFLINIGGKLLDGLVTFIDWGYKAYDATRGFVKNIFGEGGVKQFDNLMSTLSTLSSVIILASLASASGGKGGLTGGVGKGGGVGIRGAKDVAGRSRYGTTAESARRYSQRFGRDAAIKKFGAEGVRSLGGRYARSGATNLARNALVGLAGKGGAKAILGTVRPLLKRLPIIGALLDFGLSVALGEDPGRAAFKAIGAGLLGTLGAAIGSVVPVAGNLLGGLIGGVAGDAIGGALYDMFFGGKKPQQSRGKVAKAAGGGKPTTRGGKLVSGGPAKRTLKKKKKPRTLSFTPRKIKPGANTGGEAKVQQVFPNPEKPQGFLGWLGGLFGGGNQQQQKPQKSKEKQPNPQEFLVGSNDVLGRAKFFGPFATIVLKSVLGQTPDDLDYKNAGRGLNAWVQTTFGGGTLGFAGGGEVDTKQYFSGEDYTDVIAKTIKESVTKEVDTTVRNLSKELALRPPVGREEMIQDNIRRGTEGGDMQDAAMSESEMNLFQRLVYAESGGEGKIGMALVARSVLNRAGLIQSGKATTGTFAAKDKTVTGVIMGPKQYTPVSNGRINEKRSQKQLDDAKEAIKLAQNPEQLRAALKSEGIDDGSIKKLLASTGFRNYNAGAGYDASQAVNEIRYKRHTFNTAGNRALIVASSQISERVTSVPLAGGDGKFIQGNSGRSGGTHFHIGTNKPGDGSGVAAAGFRVIKNFLGKKSIFVGRSNETIPANATDEQIRGYIGRGQAVHRQTELDLQIGGTGAGNKVAFPLALNGMKYSATDGYGVSADIVGTNAFVGHGRYKPDGSLAPQQKLVLNAGAPDFYAFHGMNKVMSKDGLLKFHKGEYISVTDADSFRLVGNILTDINSIENKSQLISKAPSIIEKLKSISGYTDYENPESQIIYIEVPVEVPVPMPMGSGGGVFVGGGVNNTVPGMEALNAIG